MVFAVVVWARAGTWRPAVMLVTATIARALVDVTLWQLEIGMRRHNGVQTLVARSNSRIERRSVRGRSRAFASVTVAVAGGRTSGPDRRWSREVGTARRPTGALTVLADPRALSVGAAVLASWPDLGPRDRA
jgi:hypothetical protein